MGRLVREARLETREARRRLTIQKIPHWRLIIEGIHLGYYKGKNGGIWYIKARTPEGKYVWRKLGLADDASDANNQHILSYSQAQELAKKVGDKIRRGRDHDDTRPYTIKDAVDDYLGDFKANGKKSLSATEASIKAHILPPFGSKLISTLTFVQLNNWKNLLSTSNKRIRTGLGIEQKFKSNENDDPEYQRRRRSTANRIITIFKAILNHAYHTRRIHSNEAWQMLKPFKNVSEPKIRFLTSEEITRLINACEANFRLLVKGALLTGARYGELTALTVGDYNANNKSIFIHQSKSGKPRYIPLNNEGIKFFSQLIVGKNTQEFIFTRTDGKQWKKNYQVRPLETACTHAKIIPAANFHTLRHTYASILAMHGVALQVIAAVLGHTDTRITHKHYAHLMPSYIADVIQKSLPELGIDEKTNVTSINKPAVA